jgi:hypothetical protein
MTLIFPNVNSHISGPKCGLPIATRMGCGMADFCTGGVEKWWVQKAAFPLGHLKEVSIFSLIPQPGTLKRFKIPKSLIYNTIQVQGSTLVRKQAFSASQVIWPHTQPYCLLYHADPWGCAAIVALGFGR